MTEETYRKGIETALFMAILAALVAVGAGGRAISRWEATGPSVVRMLGNVVASMASAITFGLILLDVWPERPLLVLGIAAGLGQLGLEVLDGALLRILRKYGILAPEKEPS